MIIRILFGIALCFALVVLILGAYDSYRCHKEMADARKHAERLYEEDKLKLEQEREGNEI